MGSFVPGAACGATRLRRGTGFAAKWGARLPEILERSQESARMHRLRYPGGMKSLGKVQNQTHVSKAARKESSFLEGGGPF